MAVFQAMKALEVAVRDASRLADGMVGVKLMRNAFAADSGILTDFAAEGGERQARAELFAAAIGSYKNPQSHRDVNLNDPVEAVEIIMLASHLLRIVDFRANALEAERLKAISEFSLHSDHSCSARHGLAVVAASPTHSSTHKTRCVAGLACA